MPMGGWWDTGMRAEDFVPGWEPAPNQFSVWRTYTTNSANPPPAQPAPPVKRQRRKPDRERVAKARRNRIARRLLRD